MKKRVKVALSLLFGVLALPACRTPKSASGDHDLLVANGEKVGPDEYRAVVMLKVGEGLCTGTFVSDFQVLTAAHCVEGVKVIQIIEKQDWRSLFSMKVVAEAERWAAHPRYSIKTKALYDLAVIEFPKGTAAATVQLKDIRPKLGELVTVVGYGNNEVASKIVNGDLEQSGSTNKRKGQNRLGAIENGQMMFVGSLSERHAQRQGYGPGQKVGLGSGDSGGPLFNEQGELIGIASGVDVNANEAGDILTYFSRFCDLSSESSRQFLVEYDLLKASNTKN